MATEGEMKLQLFNELWAKFEEIKFTLIQAGIPEKRLPKSAKILSALDEIPLNKMRHGKHWLDNFIKNQVTAYRKIRSENSEEYWEKAKALGWGNEFTEIRVLNAATKKIKTDWFVSHNPLILPKKEKKEEK